MTKNARGDKTIPRDDWPRGIESKLWRLLESGLANTGKSARQPDNSTDYSAVAASSFFRKENITTPEMTHRAIRTVQLTHNGTLSHSIDGMELR